MVFLTISIVTYRTPPAFLDETWRTLDEAVRRVVAAGGCQGFRLMLVDNSVPNDTNVKGFVARHAEAPIELHAGHGNIGFGAAARCSSARSGNLALRSADSDYHLVLNPDVKLAPDAITEAVTFMEANPECGLLAPAVYDEHGNQQFLCKRYPAVLDFFLRGFAPSWLRRRFAQRCRF